MSHPLLALVQEVQTRAEIIHPQKTSESLSFRLFGWQLKLLLKTWKQALNNPDALSDSKYWKPPPMHILVDNGLGSEGECQACGYPHVSVFPVDKKAPLCHAAYLLREKGNATPGH